jgi:glycosyltransferase involved in cell wall biosynthesis
MINTPSICVGLPVYNGQKYVGKAIESILDQDYKNFELIISDNASTDDTSYICKQYARADKRIRYWRNEANIGAGPNHNRVFELANAKYFKWTAHDDENHPEFLSRCVEALERAPDSVVLAYPQAELINEVGEVTDRYKVSVASDSTRPHVRLEKILNCIDLGTPMYGVVRSEVLKKTRLHGSYLAADYVLIAELGLLGKIQEVPYPLLKKRIHPGRSMEAHGTEEEYLAWFDPRNRRKLHFLGRGDRLVLEYLKSIWYLPMRLRDRIACTRVVLICTQRERAKRWKRRVQKVFGLRAEV